MRDPKMTKPARNTARNSDMRDVLGNKLDNQDGDSIVSHVHTNDEHIHSAQMIWPSLAAGVTVTSKNIAWNLGDAFAQVVAASDITADFDIHWVYISSISAQGDYELWLYYGGSDTFAAMVPFSKAGAQDSQLSIPCQTIIIPANSRIYAKLASDNAVADTADVKVLYHPYN